MRRIPGTLLAGILLLGGTACSRWGASEERPAVYPTRGQAFVQGKPAAGAIVQLYAIDTPALEKLCPHGTVEADGSYQLTTFVSQDGAPAGHYAVTLSWPTPRKKGQEDEGGDRFRGRYADPRKPITRVEIRAEPTELPPLKLMP